MPILNMGSGGIDTSDATAKESSILYPETAYVNGVKITGNIPLLQAQTITPGTSDIVLAQGRFLSGAQTIKGDANLLPENIVSGKSIFGVNGTLESYKTYWTTFTGNGQIEQSVPVSVSGLNDILYISIDGNNNAPGNPSGSFVLLSSSWFNKNLIFKDNFNSFSFFYKLGYASNLRLSTGVSGSYSSGFILLTTPRADTYFSPDENYTLSILYR